MPGVHATEGGPVTEPADAAGGDCCTLRLRILRSQRTCPLGTLPSAFRTRSLHLVSRERFRPQLLQIMEHRSVFRHMKPAQEPRLVRRHCIDWEQVDDQSTSGLSVRVYLVDGVAPVSGDCGWSSRRRAETPSSGATRRLRPAAASPSPGARPSAGSNRRPLGTPRPTAHRTIVRSARPVDHPVPPPLCASAGPRGIASPRHEGFPVECPPMAVCAGPRLRIRSVASGERTGLGFDPEP